MMRQHLRLDVLDSRLLRMFITQGLTFPSIGWQRPRPTLEKVQPDESDETQMNHMGG